MKGMIRIFSIVSLLFATSSLALAQDANSSSELDATIQEYLDSKSIDGAELGTVLCEDAHGNKVICSGAIEETVLGIVTNVPYLTINKSANSSASKYVFSSKVSESNGTIAKGDYLKAVEGGNFGKCSKEEIPFAYAVALEDAAGKDKIRVKIIK